MKQIFHDFFSKLQRKKWIEKQNFVQTIKIM